MLRKDTKFGITRIFKIPSCNQSVTSGVLINQSRMSDVLLLLFNDHSLNKTYISVTNVASSCLQTCSRLCKYMLNRFSEKQALLSLSLSHTHTHTHRHKHIRSALFQKLRAFIMLLLREMPNNAPFGI